MLNDQTTMDKITSLCKRRGFAFPGSEIYGGLAGTWDYGPFGVALNENIKRYYVEKFVWRRDDIYELDASILMHPRVWEASGHTDSFSDPLVEDKVTHKRYRADHLLEDAGVDPTHFSLEDMAVALKEGGVKSPDGNEITEPKVFNLLVEARIGAVEGAKEGVYLRGEITQGVHVNFKNILDSMHPKIPFGVAQIGKAFRNEIVPANFLFRVREFEQIELQYYIRPDMTEGRRQFEFWKNFSMEWYRGLGLKSEHVRFREHAPHERAHYAREAWDIEYETPFGWKEAWGIHHRGDWDLRRHSEFSKHPLEYFDAESGERYTPWVIETSGGIGRAMLFLLLEAYTEDELDGEKRIFLRIPPRLAPIKVAVFPLLRNKVDLVKKARQVYEGFRHATQHSLRAVFDNNGNIGKRYRRQDEIGTPYCVTVDFVTLEDGTVTVRDRDTGHQERVPADELDVYVNERIA